MKAQTGARLWVPLSLATLAAVALSLVLMDRRARLVELRGTEAELLAQAQTLHRGNAELRAECRRLLTVAAIERVARDSYGFAAPRESVSVFEWAERPCGRQTGPRPVQGRWDYWLGVGAFPWRVPAMVFGVCALALMVLRLLEAWAQRRPEGLPAD